MNKALRAANKAKLQATQSAGLPAPESGWKGFDGSLPDSVLREFAASGVSAELAAANIRYATGEEAREILSVSRWGRGDKAKACDSGGWYTNGSTIEGVEASVVYFKPNEPRSYFEDGKIKSVKYETPAGAAAAPLLPFIPDSYCELIEQRYGVTREPSETPWQFVQHNTVIPIFLTEGWKKALALVEQGYAAICLRGVACWHGAGTKELYIEIAQFASNRRFIIAFDQDSKPATIRNVGIQIAQLGKALEQAGSTASVTYWSPELGKGIDDILGTLGDGAASWLADTIASAIPFSVWKTQKLKELQLWSRAHQLEALSLPVERHTEGAYLPVLPRLQLGQLHCLKAAMATGKTQRIGQDYIDTWKTAGGFVVCLSPLISVGKTICPALGVAPPVGF